MTFLLKQVDGQTDGLWQRVDRENIDADRKNDDKEEQGMGREYVYEKWRGKQNLEEKT